MFLLADNCNAPRPTLPCKSPSYWGLLVPHNVTRIFDHIYLVSPDQYGLPHQDPGHSFLPFCLFQTECVKLVRKQNLQTIQSNPQFCQLLQWALRRGYHKVSCVMISWALVIYQFPAWRESATVPLSVPASVMATQTGGAPRGSGCVASSGPESRVQYLSLELFVLPGSLAAAPRSLRTLPTSRTLATPPPTPTPPPASTPSPRSAPTSASSGWTLLTSWPRDPMSTTRPTPSVLMTRWGRGWRGLQSCEHEMLADDHHHALCHCPAHHLWIQHGSPHLHWLIKRSSHIQSNYRNDLHRLVLKYAFGRLYRISSIVQCLRDHFFPVLADSDWSDSLRHSVHPAPGLPRVLHGGLWQLQVVQLWSEWRWLPLAGHPGLLRLHPA